MLLLAPCPAFSTGAYQNEAWPPSSSSSGSESKAPQSPMSAFFDPVPLRQPTPNKLQSPLSAYFNPAPKGAQHHVEFCGLQAMRGWQSGRQKRLGGDTWQRRAEERFARRLESYRALLEERIAAGGQANGRCASDKAWGEQVEPLPGADSEQMVQMVSSAHVQDWLVPQRYQLGSLLGTGSYGSVCEAWDHKEGRRVAVKRVAGVFQHPAFCKRILREVAILSNLQHEHVVRILDLPKPNSSRFEVYMVMERCDTDLRKVCAHPQGVTLPQARKLAYGLLLGCRYLHSAGIYHRDLKPANCLVNWDCHVKICDFNLARTAVDDPPNGHLSPSGGSEEEESTARAPRLRRTLTAHVASRWYRSPEVILQLPYSGAMDVWSAGCIIAELFLALNEGGRTPRQGALFPGRECYGFSHAVGGGQPADWAADSGDQLDMIFNVLGTPSKMELEAVPSAAARAHACSYPERPGTGLRASLPAEAGEEGLELLAKMLRLLPGDRASMSEALQHPFFARVRRHSDEESGVALGRVDIDFDEAELEQTVITEETVSMIPNRPKHEINLFSPIRGTPSSSVWSG